MRESSRNIKSEPSMEEVAGRANFEGNASLLLFQRMRDPVVQEQMIDLLVKTELERPPTHRKYIGKESGEYKWGPKEPYTYKTREEIRDKFLQELEEIETSTEINFEGKGPDPATMPVAWRPPGEPQSVKQMSIVEAHEKGHRIRGYLPSDHFAPGFDFDAATYTEADYERLRLFDPRAAKPAPSGRLEGALRAYFSSGAEITERMSQLKNYFGFKGAEIFTASHLKYAREHYIQDTGCDNNMTQFFQAITPETEKEFLRLINTSGI